MTEKDLKKLYTPALGVWMLFHAWATLLFIVIIIMVTLSNIQFWSSVYIMIAIGVLLLAYPVWVQIRGIRNLNQIKAQGKYNDILHDLQNGQYFTADVDKKKAESLIIGDKYIIDRDNRIITDFKEIYGLYISKEKAGRGNNYQDECYAVVAKTGGRYVNLVRLNPKNPEGEFNTLMDILHQRKPELRQAYSWAEYSELIKGH